MIPVKLKMHNFMCYRDNVPSLYFDGIHTVCICGDNGNGKSALIDAMTWALWGKTRAKSDDDIIHSGQREVEVEFDFTVGEQSYRIIRKHSKPKGRGRSGQSSLDLFITGGNGFKPISGDSKSQTQQKIIDILHMDYDTFINSAYLRQGHADEFTRQPPAKRKEVLGNILRLSLYDELEEQARGLAKGKETEKSQLESTIRDIDDELARLPAYETELERAQSELTQIERTKKEQESRLNSLRQQKERLDSKKSQLIQLEEHIEETQKGIERWGGQIKLQLSRIEEYERLIAQRSTIEEGYARFTEARKSNDELNQKLGLLLKLKDSKSHLEKTIEKAQAALITDHAVIQNKIAELEATFQKLPRLKQQLQQFQSEWQQLAELERELQEKRQNGQNLRTEVHLLENSTKQLEKEIREIEDKLHLLLSQGGAKCPLCETELGTEQRKLIETKYTADKNNKLKTLQSNRLELDKKKKELNGVESELPRLEIRLNQGKAASQVKEGSLRQAIAEAEQAGNRLNEERKELAEIEDKLNNRVYALAEQEALSKLENELAKLDYDSERHEQVRRRLEALEQYGDSKRRLEEAERLVDQQKDDLAKAEEAIRELRRRLEDYSVERHDLAAELDFLPQVVNELTQAENEYKALDAQYKQAQEAVWNVRGKLQRCSELKAKKQEKEKLLGEASKLGGIYRELAKAFGKGGVQAWLIEMALPEIEDEANKLLARMTDNRMHVKIETQKETKKGDVIETLDINISDELGPRPYELFSGGEAFRINFAIRIALSKLLARRAGAPLPTLIIDEGFGTQDTVGIEKIKEAINSIQGDFDKILVITHIDELKDAFPTRIDVIKTAEGSTLAMG